MKDGADVVVHVHMANEPDHCPDGKRPLAAIAVTVGREWDQHIATMRLRYMERQYAAHHIERFQVSR